jgi:hypothetical protein
MDAFSNRAAAPQTLAETSVEIQGCFLKMAVITASRHNLPSWWHGPSCVNQAWFDRCVCTATGLISLETVHAGSRNFCQQVTSSEMICVSEELNVVVLCLQAVVLMNVQYNANHDVHRLRRFAPDSWSRVDWLSKKDEIFL